MKNRFAYVLLLASAALASCASRDFAGDVKAERSAPTVAAVKMTKEDSVNALKMRLALLEWNRPMTREELLASNASN